MRFSRVFPLLLAISIHAPVFAQEAGSGETAEQPEGAEVAEKVSVTEVAPDEAIQSRLTGIMEATGWFDNVQVEVDDSVAFLDGETPDDERKQWAGQLARNTEGVAAVVNRIEVNKTVDVAGAWSVVTKSIKALWRDFLARSPLLVAGVLALFATAALSKIVGLIVSRFLQKSRLRTGLQDLIKQLVTIGIWVAGLLISAVIVFPGMTPAKALTVLGLGSVAIGFAFKDIFENFFAGILILWKYPFDRGDFISSGDIEGRIVEITIRMTIIRQVDGELVVVPNAALFKNPVNVLTSRPSRRTTVMCGVAYDTDLSKATTVIEEALKSCESVSDDHPIEIFAREFADSSINYEITWWTGSTPLDIRQSRDEVVKAVKRHLDEAGIEIPFPQRTHWFPDPIETIAGEAKQA